MCVRVGALVLVESRRRRRWTQVGSRRACSVSFRAQKKVRWSSSQESAGGTPKMDEWLDDSTPMSYNERKQVRPPMCNSQSPWDNLVGQKMFKAQARTEGYLVDKWILGESAEKQWCSKFLGHMTNGYRSHVVSNRVDRQSLDFCSQVLVLQKSGRKQFGLGNCNSCESWKCIN